MVLECDWLMEIDQIAEMRELMDFHRDDGNTSRHQAILIYFLPTGGKL